MPDARISPYFEALAKQRRLCPECLCRPLSIESSEDPDYAYEVCGCGYVRTLRSPMASRSRREAARGKVVRFPGKKEGRPGEGTAAKDAAAGGGKDPVMRKFGYARVSASRQTATLEEQRLRAEGVAEEATYVDVAGEGMPAFDRMLDAVAPGDVVVVCAADRLGRNEAEGDARKAMLERAGAEVVELEGPES